MRLAATLCALLMSVVPAVAGTVIIGDTIGPVLSNGKSVVYLEADRMRLEAARGIVIFRADQNTAYMLNSAAKKFTRLTAERLAQLVPRASPPAQEASRRPNFGRRGAPPNTAPGTVRRSSS